METRLFFVLLCAGLVLGDEPNGSDTLAISAIKQKLLENYDTESKPDGKVVLRFGLNVRWIDMDRNGILKGSVWLRMRWNDERLAWNHGDFEEYANSTEMMHVDPSQIWVPDVVLFNR